MLCTVVCVITLLFNILREEEVFTFAQNLNISNSKECLTAITTNFKFHTKYKPQILQFHYIRTINISSPLFALLQPMMPHIWNDTLYFL